MLTIRPSLQQTKTAAKTLSPTSLTGEPPLRLDPGRTSERALPNDAADKVGGLDGPRRCGLVILKSGWSLVEP